MMGSVGADDEATIGSAGPALLLLLDVIVDDECFFLELSL